jgi:hypothetical protein
VVVFLYKTTDFFQKIEIKGRDYIVKKDKSEGHPILEKNDD